MPGKPQESPELRTAIESFNQLTPEDQSLFQSKLFTRLCNGLSKEKRAAFRKERTEFLARIEKEKKRSVQLDSVSELSTEELEAILAARKQAEK